MSHLYRFLSLTETVEFAALGILATIHWRRHRGPPAAWLAATFAALGIVLIAASFFPAGSRVPPDGVVKVLLALLIAFPYLLFLFMESFGGAPRWWRRTATALTAAVVLLGFALPSIPKPGQPRPLWLTGFILAFALQWTLLTGTVAVRFWRSGKGQAPLARRRMRILSGGAAGLALAVLLGAGNTHADATRVTALSVITALVTLASGPLILAGFSPPRALIQVWRRRGEKARDAAVMALMTATSQQEVLEVLLPHIADLVGAQATALYAADGTLMGGYGPVPTDAAPHLVAERDLAPVKLDLPFGSLMVWASAYSPYFGREDLELLRTLGVMASLALERCRLSARERSALEALEEAQRIAHVGSWQLNVTTNDLHWSAEQYRIHGVQPGSFEPTPEAVRALVHPDDLALSMSTARTALAAGGPVDVEYRIIRPDGDLRFLHSRGQVLRDAAGNPTEVIGTIRDVTDQKRLEADMRTARDQALEASRLKSQFLANMSHEIRTPMHGMLGMAQLLLTSETDPVHRRHLGHLLDSGNSLLALINAILDFSKVEAGKLELEEQDFDLAACVDGVISLLTSPAGDKGLQLNLRLRPEVPAWVRGDPLRLQQVLANLVGNALKFTERGGVSLTVGLTAAGRVRFAVQDTGIGIDPAAWETLMEPFSQADSSTTRRFGGTGLGLAISQQLVGLMGGSLAFTSEPGAGSTFWFDIDLPEVDAPASATTPVGGPLRPMAPSLPPAAAPRARILLADDAELNLEVGAGLLRSRGYVVETVTNGADAVEAALRTRYDAILIDCLMPGMDGYEATRRLRQLEFPRRTPVIALTAAAMQGDRDRCIAAGMDDYVTKPFGLDDLVATLTRWIPDTGEGFRPRARAG